jgi:hypothetical protein
MQKIGALGVQPRAPIFCFGGQPFQLKMLNILIKKLSDTFLISLIGVLLE